MRATLGALSVVGWLPVACFAAVNTGLALPDQSQESSQPVALPHAVPDQFTPVELGQVKLTGLLGRHVESVPRRLLNGQREAYLAVFEHPVDTNSWQAEHMGKWLESACNYMTYSHDASLRRLVDETVARLIQLQQPDGWLGSYAPEYRFQNYNWNGNVDKRYVPFYNGPFYDIWCHYLTMLGLMRYYETTGNQPALKATEKIADLIIATFGQGKQDLMLINHDHGFGPGVGVFPFSKLYLLTGDLRYRDFANYIASQYGRPGKVPILMTTTIKDGYPFPERAQIKHCEFELCLNGICQLYRGTAEENCIATAHNLYDNYFAPLNGTMPLHGFKSPPPGMRVPDTYYGFLETCDIVPMMRWYVEMARITGDPKYLDALEWKIYNSLLSRDLPGGSVWTGLDVPQTNYFNCCYSMLGVGLSYLPSWIYFTTTNGILVNLYEASVLSTHVAGINVKVDQTTDYPLDGTVKLKIRPEHPVTFDLLLRIPSWCQSAQVFVNGECVQKSYLTPGAIFKISRRWQTFDAVTLVLPMPCRPEFREYANNPRRKVMILHRGPLLLVATQKLNPDLDVQAIEPVIDSDGVIKLSSSPRTPAIMTSRVRFRAEAIVSDTQSGRAEKIRTDILLTPYAFSWLSSKPVPPPEAGVFNVYSEDGVGKRVCADFSGPDGRFAAR